jgi:ligand-binding SRPBCC domain-containing protein
MPSIHLITHIQAPLHICFDLARSIDLHQVSTAHTNETAIDGKTSGLIGLHEFVTWQATHFGVRQQLSSRITAFTYPVHFRDEQIKGIFQYIRHDHYFAYDAPTTTMTDEFQYASPLGYLGKLADALFVKRYLTHLLQKRNAIIKQFAETNEWKTILKNPS